MKLSTIKRVIGFLSSIQSTAEIKRRRNSQGGFSLIELMLAVGILSILSLGISSSMQFMMTEQKSFGEKFAILNLENSILTVSQNNTTCLANLVRAPGPFDISDATSTAPSATIVSLDELRAGPLAASPLLAKVGQALPGKSNNMVVTAIKLAQIIPTGGANEYKATMKVDFDPGTMARAHKSAEVEQIFTIAGTSATATFSRCGANTSANNAVGNLGASPSPAPTPAGVGGLTRVSFSSGPPPAGVSPCTTVKGSLCLYPAPQCYIYAPGGPAVGVGIYNCVGPVTLTSPSMIGG